MGFRFRKSVRILPGVRFNFSKSGMSTSIGGRGATLNLSSKGTRQTVGLPGTGLSYSTFTPRSAESSGLLSGTTPNASGSGCGLLILCGVIVMGMVMCSQKATTPASSSAATDLGTTTQTAGDASNAYSSVYVTSRVLNARSGPSLMSPVVAKLVLGDQLVVRERQGDWVEVAEGPSSYWVSAKYVAEQKPQEAGR